MTATAVVAVLVAAALGAFVQGSVGFGHNLVAAPVFALADERLVPGPAIASAGFLVLLTVVRDRSGLHLGEVGTALVGRVPGTILAAVAVAALPADGLAVFFAGLVLVAVAITASGVALRPTRATLVGAGALSGFMGTATSIGGPPMAVLYAGEQGRRLRGTLAGFFLTGILMSLLALVVTGSFGLEELRLSALPLPAITVGFALSSWGARRLDAGQTRPAVLAVAALSAASVLVDALRRGRRRPVPRLASTEQPDRREREGLANHPVDVLLVKAHTVRALREGGSTPRAFAVACIIVPSDARLEDRSRE